MRFVLAGNDKRRDIETEQILGIGTRRGVAIDQRARHAGNDELVALDVELRVVGGELDDRAESPMPRDRRADRR